MPRQNAERRDIDPRSSAWALYAYKLRKYRERAGLSRTEVGEACVVSPKLIAAIENLHRLPGEQLSASLDKLLDADFFEDQHHQILREAAIPPGFFKYIQFEGDVASLRIYEPMHIPGLFQTEASARHILGQGQRNQYLEEVVALRLGRQDILNREPPPLIIALIKEGVLHDTIGTPEVMREQLAHLIELGHRLDIHIEILPFGSPVYPSGAFNILGFGEGDDMAFIEGAGSRGHLLTPSPEVKALRETFDRARGHALRGAESEQLIRSIMEDL
ncbi:helix-turn-helix transcriptional regulator [Actinomadura kijaniata]|uniref:Transcriptional regulator with XRE-family HTH domain n=1 Tax=Actinomadura namibiensis TaxID=182080 RepID=A0A7W3LVG2_ACTNM|nr:helix-turn-helix transcriptional regulator [Actinomadura namibiensis]MBA8955038.1 transcriptional regulator with XRE-family HTH domain [Actinomadura namibiensis]